MKKLVLKNRKNFIEAVLMLGYGIYSMYLYFSSKILFFVHPDYAFLALFSGAFLSFIGIFLLFKVLFSKRKGDSHQHVHSCDCHESHWNLGKISLFVLPLLVAIIFQPKPLSSALAATRSTGLYNDAALSRDITTFSGFSIDSTKRSLVDWIRLFSQDPEPDHYKDLKAKLIGFVMRDSSLPPNYFLLSRFVISCCAADARPVGILVQYDPQKVSLKDDEWIELEGHFGAAEINEQRQPVLILDQFKKADIPENPYAT